jgi:hypothetical protein
MANSSLHFLFYDMCAGIRLAAASAATAGAR